MDAFSTQSQSNTLSLISRLPPELLAAIFICCTVDHHDVPRIVTPHVPSWVNVSYVCRYWRDVALDCPPLWTYHFLVSVRWTEELLARSQGASLKISIWLPDELEETNSWWIGPVKKLLNHMECVEELQLHLRVDDADQILSMLSSPAPRLQFLRMSGFPPDWSLPLFHGDTPALRSLDLRNYPVPWYSFNLSGLTYLNLDGVPHWIRQNMVEFLTTLRGMQDLKYLYLDSSLASGSLSSTAFHTFRKVNLPHLSHLLIISPLSVVIAFLSCVDVPLETEIRLECQYEGDSFIQDCSLLSSTIAQRFSILEDQALPSMQIRSLRINFSVAGSTILVFSPRERDLDGFDATGPTNGYWDSNVPLEVTLCWDALPMSIQEDITCDMCCSSPLTNVQSLHVIYPPFSPDFWRKTLSHLQGVRYMKLELGLMPDLSALSLTDLTTHEVVDSQGSERDRDRVLTPELEELQLLWIRFSQPGDDSDLPGPALTERCLFDILSTRHAPRGRVITRVHISESDQFEDVVQYWGDGDMRAVGEDVKDSDSREEHGPNGF